MELHHIESMTLHLICQQYPEGRADVRSSAIQGGLGSLTVFP
jgi:hypothetical protein